jgi:hypothetical protein
MTRPVLSALALALAAVLSQPIVLQAHSGPPFPIVSNRIVGAYDVSIWSDPDATNDGTVAGKFWVVLAPAQKSGAIPDGTRAHLTIQALGRKVPALAAAAEPVDGLITRQFAALLMDHEGPYRVRVAVDGPLGRAEVETNVDATYDLRPPIGELLVFLFPFSALGALWVVMLRRRRRASKSRRRVSNQAADAAESGTDGTGASGV